MYVVEERTAGVRLFHVHASRAASFKVKGERSRSPGQLMLRPEVYHIFRTENLRTSNLVYRWRTKTRIADKRRTSKVKAKVKVAKSRDPSGSCWPIYRERKVPETPKLVGRLPTSRAQSFKVKMLSKIEVNRLINAETESVSPTNFKLSRRLEHALSTAMASYKGLWSLVIARGREHTVSAAHGGHTICLILRLLLRMSFVYWLLCIYTVSLSVDCWSPLSARLCDFVEVMTRNMSSIYWKLM